MATVPFPTNQEMIRMGVGLTSIWRANFFYPEGYKQELKERFPDVEVLHKALDRDDSGMVNELLSAYLTKLWVVTVEQLVEAAEQSTLEEIVDRARQAVEFKKFLDSLERRYFPERTAAWEKARQEALETWG